MSTERTGTEATGGVTPVPHNSPGRARGGSRRTRGESWAWIFMRLSGVVLLFLVLGHLFVIRVLAGMNEVNVAFVTLRWSGMGWRSYDFFMLLLAMIHGANGVRGLAYDHVSPALRAWCLRAACTVCLAATVLGSYVIITFPRPL